MIGLLYSFRNDLNQEKYDLINLHPLIDQIRHEKFREVID